MDKGPEAIKSFLRTRSSILWANEHLEPALKILEDAGEDPKWCDAVRAKALVRKLREEKKIDTIGGKKFIENIYVREEL